jgi:hypothetical protein
MDEKKSPVLEPLDTSGPAPTEPSFGEGDLPAFPRDRLDTRRGLTADDFLDELEPLGFDPFPPWIDGEVVGGVVLAVLAAISAVVLLRRLTRLYGPLTVTFAVLFALWLASIAVPPWEYVTRYGITWPAGYWPIFDRPPGTRPARVDLLRLVLSWVALAGVAGALWAWVRWRR